MTDQKKKPILHRMDGGENLLLDAPGPRKSPEPSITDRASKSESSSRSSRSSKSSKSGQHKETDKGDFLGLASLHLTIGSLGSREKDLKKIRAKIKEKEEKRKEVKKRNKLQEQARKP